VYILQRERDFENTLPEGLLQVKISAYQGVKARNDRLILGYLAINGPVLPYVIFRDLKGLGYYKDNQYPTVHRRIRGLVKEGYLTEAGTRPTLRGKQSKETLYGLTTLGWVSSLAIDRVRKDVLSTLERNIDTAVPEKGTILSLEVKIQSLYPGISEFLRTVFYEEEIYAMITSLLLGYLKTNAPSIDVLATASIEEWIPWIKPVFEKAVIEYRILLPQGIDRSINLFRLLDNPEIFKSVNQLLPIISLYAESQIHTFVTWLFASSGLKSTFDSLTPEDKPSERAEAFLAGELPKLLQGYEDSLREQGGVNHESG